MNSKVLALVLMLLNIIPSISFADELDDSYAICMEHYVAQTGPGAGMRSPFPDASWQHCLVIKDAKEDRDRSQRDADEMKNTDLKKTRDLAKQIQGGK